MDTLLLLFNLLDQLLEIGLLSDIDVSDAGRVISNAFSSDLAGAGHTE